MAAATAGQAVDAGAGRVWLAAGAHGLAVGQIKTRKLRGFERVDVAWQFVAIVTATVLVAAALTTTARATTFRAWASRCGTTLTVTTVVKSRIAALLLSSTAFAVAITTTFASAFTTAIALAFKARCALWTLWPVPA
jgi:hypothetical protein